MIVEQDRYLEHYGILGMHWGVRKDKTTGSKSEKKQKPTPLKALTGKGKMSTGQRIGYGAAAVALMASGALQIAEVLRDTGHMPVKFGRRYENGRNWVLKTFE